MLKRPKVKKKVQKNWREEIKKKLEKRWRNYKKKRKEKEKIRKKITVCRQDDRRQIWRITRCEKNEIAQLSKNKKKLKNQKMN